MRLFLHPIQKLDSFLRKYPVRVLFLYSLFGELLVLLFLFPVTIFSSLIKYSATASASSGFDLIASSSLILLDNNAFSLFSNCNLLY